VCRIVRYSVKINLFKNLKVGHGPPEPVALPVDGVLILHQGPACSAPSSALLPAGLLEAMVCIRSSIGVITGNMWGEGSSALSSTKDRPNVRRVADGWRVRVSVWSLLSTFGQAHAIATPPLQHRLPSVVEAVPLMPHRWSPVVPRPPLNHQRWTRPSKPEPYLDLRCYHHRRR
jgi:hypothetical protein